MKILLSFILILLVVDSVTPVFAQDKVVVIPMGSSLFKGDQYYTISNAAFAPDSETTPYSRPAFISTYGYLELGSPLTAFTASVNLPDGAIVSQLSTYVEEAGFNCMMIFARQALNNHDFHTISDATNSANLSAGEYGPIHIDIANEIIENQNYHYHLTWACSGLGTSADRLYAVRIKYRLQ